MGPAPWSRVYRASSERLGSAVASSPGSCCRSTRAIRRLKAWLDYRGRIPILKYVLDQTIDLDRTFQALADKSRRAMVERLTLGPASVSELAEPLAMSLAAVLQHVQVLESSGLVKTEKVGRTRTCQIDRAAMTAVEQWIRDRRLGWESRLDRLGEILHEAPTNEEKR
jgi:DNA-binding transcriptional ArsR family regulator